MKLTFPYPPSANRYWRVDRRGFTYVSEEARAYKASIYLLARAALRAGGYRDEFPVFDSRLVKITVRIYRPQRRGDLDNRLKVLLDAVKGVLFTDDEQIDEIHARRFDDKHNPRVEVEFDAAAETAA